MIYKAWADSDYAMPDIIEQENPDRVCFTLPVECLDINAECPNKNDKETKNVLINETKNAECPNKNDKKIKNVLINETKNAECPNKSDKETKNVLINEQSQEQEQTKENLLIALLTGQPDITQKIMAKKLNLTDRSVRRIISDLQKQGKLKRIGSNKKGQWLVIKN